MTKEDFRNVGVGALVVMIVALITGVIIGYLFCS
jgi:hypothetical protein